MRAYAAKLAARAKKGEENYGAMRDLNGRRIRHVEAERKIQEWQAQEHKVDNRQISKTFGEIKKGKFPTMDKVRALKIKREPKKGFPCFQRRK